MTMKKPKRHYFAHKDPEAASGQVQEPQENEHKKGETKVKKAVIDDPALFAIKKDLKKTGLSILLFLVLLLILFFVQLKTNILSPVLKLFGL